MGTQKIVGFVGVVGLALGLGACDQGDQRLKEKAAMEGEQAATKQIEAEKKFLEDRSRELEADLARRQLFYTAVSGTFEGVTEDGAGKTMKIRFKLGPSIPPYRAGRIRASEEIIHDLTNLYLKAHVVQWDDGGVGLGCDYLSITPDLENGNIWLISSDCISSYSISLSNDHAMPQAKDSETLARESKDLADAVLAGKLVTVPNLRGFRQTISGGVLFAVTAQRK